VRNPAPRLALVLALLTASCSTAGDEVAAPETAASQTPSPSVAEPLPPLLGRGTYVAATAARKIIVFREPDTATADFVLDTRNPFGQRTSMLVVGARRDAEGDPWYEVSLPIRPNGSTGWMRGYELRLRRAEDRVVIDLSDRTLHRFHGGALVDRYSVAVGTPDSPTTTGTFFVWAQVPQSNPYGSYGIYALGLSGFSDTYTEWEGSNGRIAIHGTSDPSDRGQRVSHGCIRVYNADMASLTDLPMGTPVVIRR
jgi:lipoprotein-anchoring transpeptidase ErfK/SrfK